MTRIPLVANGRVGSTILAANLSHFSTVAADGLAPLFGNLVDWDPRLTSAGALTFTELASLAEAVRVQLAMGCTPGPECAAIDAAFNDVVQAVSDSIAALLSSCSADVASPTRTAFDHWKTLISLAQALGLNNLEILDCARNVLDALVSKVATDGLAHPSEAAVDSLHDLENQALGLAFSTVADKAHGKKHDVLEKVIDGAGATAAGDPTLSNLQRMIGLKGKAQGFAFADLERRVLEKSVAAARTAISRLQQACDVDANAPATEVAKELARTWVAFVNQDPTVAPTLSADLRTVVDNCGGNFVTVVGDGSYATGVRSGSQPYSLLGANADPPVRMTQSGTDGIVDMTVSSAGKIIAVDVTAADPFFFQAFATLDFQFPKAGTLKIDINESWMTLAPSAPGASAFVRGPSGYLINNCLSPTCNLSPQPSPGAPATVTVPVAAGSFRTQVVLTSWGSASAGSGRVFTLTYTPAP
jgi:hypothetical protein